MNRVLIVIARFDLGGVPTQAFLWAKFLNEHGYESILLAPQVIDTSYLEILEAHAIRHERLVLTHKRKGWLSNYRYFKTLIRALNTYRPFAILPFNKTLGYNINLIWRFTSAKKCFFMERNHGYDDKTTLLGSVLRKLSMANSDGLIYNSSAAANRSPFPKKTFVIKNSFVNPLHINEGVKDAGIPGIYEHSFVVLHIANISTQKNYPLLLNSWPKIREIYPEICLVVVGAEVRVQLPEVMEKLKQPGVLYLGGQSHVLPLIKRANLCILATHYEGCPNVILEYMNSKKLLCASNVPSIREVVSELNLNLLFDNSSVDDFVSKVKAAIKLDVASVNRIVEANHQKLLDQYSDNNFKKLLEVLG